jgi:5-methylcytosine-specific restriction endonuclease McrA
METKCRICGRSDVEFYPGRRVCKGCTVARVAAYKKANPEKLKEWTSKPEYKAKAIARTKAWVKAHPERAKQAHKDKPSRAKSSEYLNRWRRKDPERARLIELNRRHRRRAREAGGKVTKTDLAAILMEFGMTCHICGGEIAVGELQFDHVIPIAGGGAHDPSNIRPAHAKCNRKKSGPRQKRI